MARNERKQGLQLSRKIGIIAATFAIQITSIVLLFPIIDSTVFSISVLPAMVSGWLFGRKYGLIVGICSVTTAIVFNFLIDHFDITDIRQALFGGPVVVFLGVAFGHLRDIGQRYRQAVEDRVEAEATQKRLEKQLQQAQKMDAIGTLAGGVAHDMNNILGMIMSSVSNLKQDIRSDRCKEEDVETALKACRRGRELTKNLLGFARKGTYVQQALNINIIIDDVLRLIRPALRKNVTLTTDIAPKISPIYGDRSQIEQTLVNICINAAEAISGDGTIHISTRNSTIDDLSILNAHGLKNREYSIISIADNGLGMTPETVTHAFEPFFTTKSAGKGTGLGLSMAYGTLKKHNGAIDINSSLGQGTTITLIFPSLQDTQLVTFEQTPIPPPFKRTTGHILLVDDEPMLRNSYSRMLRQLGFDVTSADSGEQAVSILRDAPQKFDLVILDFIMPGLSGTETLQQLKTLEPNIQVLIASGYSKSGEIDDALKQGALGFIQKPFDIDELSALLKQLVQP